MYSEHIVLDNDEFEPVFGEVGCAMTDLRYVFYLGLGLGLIAAALGVWLLSRLRPW